MLIIDSNLPLLGTDVFMKNIKAAKTWLEWELTLRSD